MLVDGAVEVRGVRRLGSRRCGHRRRGGPGAAWTPRRTTATSPCRPTWTGSTTRRPRCSAPDLARRTGPADHVRLGPPVPALDRPVPQGRPPERRVPADHRLRSSRGHGGARTGRSRSVSSSTPRRSATPRCSPSTVALCCACTSPTGRPGWPRWSQRVAEVSQVSRSLGRPLDRNPLRDERDKRLPRIAGPCGARDLRRDR